VMILRTRENKRTVKSKQSSTELKHASWINDDDIEFSQEYFENELYSRFQTQDISFLLAVLYIKEITLPFNKTVKPSKNAIRKLDELFRLLTIKHACNSFTSERVVLSWYTSVGFLYREEDRVIEIKAPVFFFNADNKKKIKQFNTMISDTIHYYMQKLYIADRKLYKVVKKFRDTTKLFEEYPVSKKERILNDLYRKTLSQCDDSTEERGFYDFTPSVAVLETVVDNTHSAIYLGECYRKENIEEEDDNKQSYIRYAVITAYFCVEPVMVHYSRINQFQYKFIRKIGINHHLVHWANNEMSFEQDCNFDTDKAVMEATVDPCDEGLEPHPLEHLCKRNIRDYPESIQLFISIYADMQIDYWRIFCKIPKTNQLFEKEERLIESYLNRFSSVNIHYMICGLSILLGRMPAKIIDFFTGKGLMGTVSATSYVDRNIVDLSPLYNASDALIPDDEFRMLELNAQNDLQAERLEILNETSGLRQQLEDALDELDYMTDVRVSMNTITKDLADISASRMNTITDYTREYTIAVARIINDDDAEDDVEDSNGNKLPKSMLPVTITLENGTQETFMYKYDDISRGLAYHPLPAINTVNIEIFSSFIYTKSNVAHPDLEDIIEEAQERSSEGCQCCSDDDHVCDKDCHCQVGVPAYNEYGRITDTVIAASDMHVYECNSHCECDDTCRSRVLQKGSLFRYQVFKTLRTGWGIRTLDFIPRGSFVGEYAGELINESIAEERGRNYEQYYGRSYLFDLLSFSEAQPLESDEIYTVDAFHYSNGTRWMNHSCDPNTIARKVFVETREVSLPRIGFYALRDIRPGEEITFDYAYDNKKLEQCRCGSDNCKGWLR
jgi:hypothetical protein